MKEPDEKWLDRHFRQQLVEYGPVFKQEACLTDVAMIEYWLQIYKAAPKQQKWARNCLMLLMYGQLKEIGRLTVPFTDMRNRGKDLNEMLDGYKGLPVPSCNRSTQIVLPETREQYSQSHLFNTAKDIESKRNKENRENSSSTRSSAGAESLQTLYETFDSHACYHKSKTKAKREKNSANAQPKTIRRTALSPIPECRSSCEFEEQPCCSTVLRDKESVTTAKGSPLTLQASLAKLKSESDLECVAVTADKACQESPSREVAQGEALDAELIYLRMRNKQLRRECLIYYNRKGDLRRCPKYPKYTVKHLGFLVGAYRAHYHFTRWQHQSKQPLYFHQEYDRVNGWRTYRRILLLSSVPRSRMRHGQGLDGKRQCLLQRMCRILQLKNVCTELGVGQISGQELQNLLTQLEDKYLALANSSPECDCSLKAVVRFVNTSKIPKLNTADHWPSVAVRPIGS